jgi:hypothetical protein
MKKPEFQRISYLNHYEPTCQREYWLMGERLIVKTNTKQILKICNESFGRFPPNNKTENQPLNLHIIVKDTGQEINNHDDLTRTPVYQTQGHLMYISVNADNTAVIDLSTGFSFGFITPQMLKQKAYFRYNFIEAMSLAMLSLGRNYLPIHASCVVKNNVSILIQGRAGSGKSTLAYACARRGYKILAEDVVHAQIKRDGIIYWGNPWKFHLLPDAKQHFPELSNQEVILQMNNEWKMELDLEEVYPGSTICQSNPGPVVILNQYKNYFSKIIELDIDEATKCFEIIWPWMVGWKPEFDAAVHTLLKNGTYQLILDGTPDDAVDLLDELAS